MSGINAVLKGDGCVLKKWVCRSQRCFVFCACVSSFPDADLSPAVQLEMMLCSFFLPLCAWTA